MQLIRNWLNGSRDYRTGVSLYLQFGKDDSLKSLFRKEKESPFKKKKLLEVLLELYRQQEQATTTLSEEKEQPREDKIAPDEPSKTKKKGWEKEYEDPILQQLKDNWQANYAEMKSLQARLLDIDNIPERGAAAHKILDLDDECDKWYIQRDFYIEHGRLPEAPNPEYVSDPLKWPLELQNAKRNLRRNKNKLKKNPNDVECIERIEMYKEKIAYYKEKLKLDVD